MADQTIDARAAYAGPVAGTTKIPMCDPGGNGNAGTASQLKDYLAAFFAALSGDHEATVSTGNGFGSTNTKIRRFTTTLRSVGTAITYADSATLGATFAINTAGLYEVSYTDGGVGAPTLGISVNSTHLTTSVASLAYGEQVGYVTAGNSATVTRVLRLAVGDVIRPHSDASTSSSTSDIGFSIKRIG